MSRATLGAALLWCAAMASACGAASPAARAGAATKTGEATAPADPLRMIPAGARSAASADLDAMRGSALFDSAERWLRHHACLASDPLDWLLQRTSRVVVAGFGATDPEAKQAGLGLFRGSYLPDDLARALRQSGALIGEKGAPVATAQAGRMRVLRAGSLSAVQLEPGLMAVGSHAQLRALLALAGGKTQDWLATSELAHSLNAQAWLGSHSAAAAFEFPAPALRRLQRGLAAIGGRRLGVGVQRGGVAFTIAPGSGNGTAEARVLYPDEPTANAAAAQAMPVLQRANFLLRLIGAPLPIERTQVSVERSRMDVSLALSASELQSLIERLDWMLDADVPECGVSADADDARVQG